MTTNFENQKDTHSRYQTCRCAPENGDFRFLPQAMLYTQVALYQQWQWAYWYLQKEVGEKAPLSATSGMWEFTCRIGIQDWEENVLMGAGALAPGHLAAQEQPLTFTKTARSTTADKGDGAALQHHSRSLSELMGLERRAPRHSRQGNFDGERHARRRNGLPGLVEVFKLWIAMIFFDCTGPFFLVVLLGYVIWSTGLLDFGHEHSLEQTLRDLRQAHSIQRDAQLSSEAAAPPDFVREDAADHLRDSNSESVASPHNRFVDRERAAPSSGVNASPSPVNQDGPSFWQRFFYQLFVMFAFTLLPWWGPDQRLIGTP